MAITREDFKNIPSSGVIPDDRVPSYAFAVAYAFTYTGAPSGSTFNHTFTGKIVLYFYDGGGSVKYVVEIEQTYNLFIFPLAPGLVLYTWNWVPSAEKIKGRKGEAEDAPPMETLGSGTFGVEPAEDSGTSNGEVIVDSRFYSGIFEEPLESGDKVKIKFHNLSAGFVVARASLQLATELGGGFAAIFDWTSNLRMANQGAGGLLLQHREIRSGGQLGALRIRQFKNGLKNCCIAKTADDVLWVLANWATYGRLFFSEDGGTSLPNATYRTPTGETKEIAVFGEGYKILDLKAAPQGGLVALAEKDNVLYTASSADNFISTRKVGPKRASGLYQLGLGGTTTADATILVAAAGHEYLIEGSGAPIERPAPDEEGE
jgi:hypothetical protein